MIGYFDSSVVLSLLLQDKYARLAAAWWHQCDDRAASIVLEAECRIVVRRMASLQRHSQRWLRGIEPLLDDALAAIQLRMVDREIVQDIRQEPRLCACRALDAIHVATALHFSRNAVGTDFRLCTFDQRMAVTAQSVGLSVMTHE